MVLGHLWTRTQLRTEVWLKSSMARSRSRYARLLGKNVGSTRPSEGKGTVRIYLGKVLELLDGTFHRRKK